MYSLCRLHRSLALVCAVSAMGTFSATVAQAQAIPVIVSKDATGNYQLLRGGKPYFIKGAGGSGSLEKLHAAGANSLRTWGADNLGPTLDAAQKLGMTVCVGIWLGHTEHGFHYDDPKQVAEQLERVRQAVLKYKDHPALLMWGLGNEMEGYQGGDSPAIWKAVEDAAKVVKQLDPKHPTMTVVAEIGGRRIPAIHQYCPDIDIVGVNSYAGAVSIPARYKAAGGVKPFVLTEYGPAGTWESGKNAWGATPEPTSTQKATAYRNTYQKTLAHQPQCLGGYAFTWGNKQEVTATWFGMLLPDGNKLAAVDALTEEWSGKPPANRCPEIAALQVIGPDQVVPGATVKAKLDAKDPEGKPLQVTWVLQHDTMQESLNGETQAVPPTYPDAIVKSGVSGAEVRMPTANGAYRLFVFVRDGDGGAATGNLPLLVNSKLSDNQGKGGTLSPKIPFTLYSDKGATSPYFPSGYMGNAGAVKLDEGWAVNPHSGKTCLRCDYNANDNWAGVVWQHPANDWGDLPGGYDVTGASKLTFWARGEQGGESVEFQFGLLKVDKPYFDTARGKLSPVALTKEWKQYTIDLRGQDLSRIKTGFCWVVAGQGKPVTFYLDDIRFE